MIKSVVFVLYFAHKLVIIVNGEAFFSMKVVSFHFQDLNASSVA